MSKRKKLALLLILGPTCLLIISFIGFVIYTLLLGGSDSSTNLNELIDRQSADLALLGAIIFTISLLGSISWLPALVIGIVLLIKKPLSQTTIAHKNDPSQPRVELLK